MKLGIAVGEDMWTFFKEIYQSLALHYQTEIFKRKTFTTPLLYGRLNRWAYNEGIRLFLRRNDICFFEWASEHLMMASKMPKTKPLVTRLHSFELYDWAPKINWDSVDKIILVSTFMQNAFCDLYPEHSYKTIVINNGQSLDLFKPPERRTYTFTLGMLCAILPVKRVYETILTFYELRQSGLEVKLRIAGTPKDKSDARYPLAIHNLVEKLDLGEYVIFDGFVTDTHTWLHNIDIFISNSYWEGQQVALIEAMASGCYCLSHFWSGADEMLPSENLFITNSELQQKIIEFYKMADDEKSSHGMHLRDIATEKYDIEKTKEQIHQVIETALATD